MTPDEMRELRERNELTQTQAAHLFGVDPRSWRRWESETRPVPEVAARLLTVLHVPGVLAILDRLADGLAPLPPEPPPRPPPDPLAPEPEPEKLDLSIWEA